MAQRVISRVVQQNKIGSRIYASFFSVAAESSTSFSNGGGFDDLKLDSASVDASEILRRRKKVDPKIDLRRQYNKGLSELRKQYAEEEAARRRKEEKKKEAIELQIMVQKGQKAALKEERSRARSLQVAEEDKASRAMRAEERALRADRRLFREKQYVRREEKKKAILRHQSSVWIEEKELERRILEALADPHQLTRSFA